MTLEPVRFLLVDDLEENLLSLEALLRRDGLLLLKARTGDEALELLLRHDVALALVDVQMPGLNGFELAELMRGFERTRRVPIIFVTAGSSDRQRRFRGYEAGAVDFIAKPIEPDVLRSKAGVFFELYRQRQQIAAQRDALKEADRRKDEFLATLAHELRNPLAPLRSGLDVLSRSPDAAEAAAIRELMDRQLQHIVRLIDDLLDVSRVSRGKIELRRERVEAAAMLRVAVETSRPLIDEGGHTFALDLAAEPIWLDADPTRLAQIVSNLLNNAAKYTPEGGRISLTLRRDGGMAVIAVADSGVGVPPDKLGEVFELFAQIDHRLERARGGLGIGLALVKQLVLLHDGAVTASSPGIGQGSVFEVRLPVAAAPANLAVPAPQTAPAQRPLRVLVVDDNEDVAQTVGWLLEAIGHDYRIVHDGREAAPAALDFRPDAILLDIGLPGMDGYAVCRALRAHTQFAHTPIIAQTGWGQERDKALAAEAGFDHHFVKPVSLKMLEPLLAEIGAAKAP